jgi:DNA polymerase delta subunit 1
MVDFRAASVEEAMALGREAAARVTQLFVRPIELQFEKVYFPFLLGNKKRYAALLWTRPDRHDYMDMKGIESVRRDNAMIVPDTLNRVLDLLLVDRDVAGAIDYVKRVVADLLCGRVDISKLVISKQLNKTRDGYKGPQVHAELAERMRRRDPTTAPKLGSRVPYVMVGGAKGSRTHENAEDPLYALEHNVPIDARFYIERQLRAPLERLLEPIVKDTASLFSGEHTRTVVTRTPAATSGGIMTWAVRGTQCLGCRTRMPDGARGVCDGCRPREAEIYMGALETAAALECDFARLWTQCQDCQGGSHQEVLCSNNDCPIYYRRVMVRKDLATATARVAQFGGTTAMDW